MSSDVRENSLGKTPRGHAFGRTWHSIVSPSRSSSMTRGRAVSRVIACSPVAIAPVEGCRGPGPAPVGSTTGRRAPQATANCIGVLLAIAPSQSGRPSMWTGANAPGMALLASIACVAGPRDSTTASPDRISVVTTLQGQRRILQIAVGEMKLEEAP
jgi:hypothetical protein